MRVRRSPGPAQGDAAHELRAAFALASARTARLEEGRGGRLLPWFVLMGEDGAGKSTLLRALSARRDPARADSDGAAEAIPCHWTWLSQGVTLEVSSRCLPVGEPEADLSTWRLLLRLLARTRDGRLPEGLILTVPATTLVGLDDNLPDRVAASTAKGEWLAERVRELTRATGRSVPVYALVTKCDAMSGFDAFVGAWPARHRREMLGWSNPHPIDTPYEPAWLDEAWEAIGGDVDRVQRQLLLTDRPWHEDDALFRWPDELRSLAEPLRAYLEPLLGEPGDPGVLFRGLYLCGQLGVPRAEPPGGTSRQLAGLARPRSDPAIVFVRDLFDAKIFPEHGLARPSRRGAIRATVRRRAAAAAAVAAVLALTLGLAAAAWSLKGNAVSLEALLRESRGHLSDPGDRDPVFLRDAARGVMARIVQPPPAGPGKLVSAFLPSSWLSRLHDDLVRAMALIHERILLKAVAVEMEDKLDRLIAEPTPDPAAAGELRLEARPEYRELAALLPRLLELERHAAVYQHLDQAGTLQPVGRLLRYALAADIPAAALDDLYYLEQGLHRAAVPPLQLASHRDPLSRRVGGLLNALQAVTLGAERLPDELAVLARQLDALAETTRRDGAARTLDGVAYSMAAVQRRLSRPDLAWLSADRFDLGPAFQHDIVQPIQQSALLDRHLLPAWQAAGDATLAKVQAELARVRSARFGAPLIQDEGRARLRLAPEVGALAAVLSDLYAQPFMAVGPTPAVAVSPRSDTVWDLAALLEIIRLYEQYVTFRSTGLPQVPVAVQPAVHRAAVERIGDQMLARLSHAEQGATPFPVAMKDRELRDAVDQFERTAAALARIEGQFTELGMTEPAHALAEHLATHAIVMLTAVEHRLAREALYRGRPACTTRTHPSLAAFGAQDRAELIGLLTRQRDRIADLARTYAKPLLAAVGRRPDVRAQVTRHRPESQIVTRWEGILTDLDRYERREPGNAVAALERFVLIEMDRITLRNYAEKLQGDLRAPVSRYFLERHEALRRAMRDRCAATQGQSAARDFHAPALTPALTPAG